MAETFATIRDEIYPDRTHTGRRRRAYEPAPWSGWYAADIRMHHPLTTPARHALYHRLAARNRI
ncbi:hypothetical protein HFP71_33955 [Streptomyces sp. ARC32]